MLIELKIKGFAVIDVMEIHFLRPGLNILTGETGAGKSVLVKSLGLLLGAKASPESVRAGFDQAVIEGAFDISERGDLKQQLQDAGYVEKDDLLVVRRIISRSGKHRVYINGHLATLNVLEDVLSELVEITGQHEHQTLLKATSQLRLVDRFADLEKGLLEYVKVYDEKKDAVKELAELREVSGDRIVRLEFLDYQIREIEAFNPQLGDEQDLAAQYQRAKYSFKIKDYAQKADTAIYSGDESVLSRLGDLIREGELLAEMDERLSSIVEELKTSRVHIEEASFRLREFFKEEAEVDLDQVEERLSQWRKIQKKYGQTKEEVIKFLENAKAEKEKLEQYDESINALEKKVSSLEGKCHKLASGLHDRREKAAQKLISAVNKELKDLNMKGTEFFVDLQKTEELTATGFSHVQFQIKNSPKELPKSLSKVASGGELSRIMLAIKQKFAHHEKPMTYFFDEVDTGVSGPTAEKVGRKLKNLGKSHQIVSITHLPQVAAFADAHFLISKEVRKNQVFSEVHELDKSDRIKELGRLISGEKITATSLAHAKELLANVAPPN